MPTSHKPRKRYVPKRNHLAAIGAIERMQIQQHRALLSRSETPLNARQVRDLALYCHSALDAIRTGQGNDDHVNHLALATNVSLMLCEQGLGKEWIDKVREAQDAVVTLTARRYRIDRFVITGTELQRMQALLDLHESQLESPDCTEGLVVRALAEIKRRMQRGDVMEARAA